jgi:hypothetical protein
LYSSQGLMRPSCDWCYIFIRCSSMNACTRPEAWLSVSTLDMAIFLGVDLSFSTTL